MIPHLSELPSWAGARRVCVDIETRDPRLTKQPGLKGLGIGVRRDGYIVGVSFAIDDGTPCGPAHYLPVRHEGGGNYHDPEMVFAYLRDQAKHFRGEIAGCNLSYDLDYLEDRGVKFEPSHYRDAMISGPLLDVPPVVGLNLMSLDAQCERAEIPGKDEEGLNRYAEERGWHPKKDLWRMPAGVVGPYAIQDVRAPLALLRKHERELADQDLLHLYDMECELLPILLKMRQRGVAVNLDKLGEIREWTLKREKEWLDEVARLTGIRIDVGDTFKPEVVAPALEKYGITVPLTLKTKQPSITAGWLENLEGELGHAICEARRVSKIRTTFCQSLIDHEVKGRIHCTFNQLKSESESGETKGAGFGRCSSSDPNMQQQPTRHPEIGAKWRSLFIPDDGEWVCLDFSGQEPRWITHYAETIALGRDDYIASKDRWTESTKSAAIAAANACRTNPKWDNHAMMALMMNPQWNTLPKDEAKVERADAKTIFLGLAYGMGGAKLCRDLGLPTTTKYIEWLDKTIPCAGPEGQALLDKFDAAVPYVRALARRVQATAKDRGYITTIYGRRCRFPFVNGKMEWAHKALNRLIQGTSADQMKLAMIEMDGAGIQLQLQVHDEVDFTMRHPQQAVLAAEIMSTVVDARVPFPIDIETGPSWGEIS